MAYSWTYSTPSDLQNFLGVNGVEAFGSHDDRGWEANATECCEQATDEINLYVYRRYADAALQSSRMLQRWAVVLSACFFCERRGNPIPESILADFNRIMEMLKGVHAGTILLPGVALRSPSVPAMSNMKIDRRYIRRQQRVAENSTQVPISRPRDTEPYHYGY